MYVKDLNLCVTVQLLEDTRPVPQLKQLFEDHGCCHKWSRGQKPHPSKVAKQFHAIRRTTCLLSFQFFITGLNAREFYAENIRNTQELRLDTELHSLDEKEDENLPRGDAMHDMPLMTKGVS